MLVSAVSFINKADEVRACALAQAFGVPLWSLVEFAPLKEKALADSFRSRLSGSESILVFCFEEGGLGLHLVEEKRSLCVRADFHGPTVRYRRLKGGGTGQLIAKAVGIKGGERPRVHDLTAGLGGDAFVLASLGCEVVMVERVPEVCALLRDALRLAEEFGREQDGELLSILERMTLVESDSLGFLHSLATDEVPRIIYLDPMFPVKKKGALVKKEMQVFHRLVGSDSDSGTVLEAAMQTACSRVIVKRPKGADFLGGLEPSFQLKGKSNRFDVYLS